VDIYAGSIFYIHYKYAFILNVTYVTMMYGLGMPLLFPVAAITLFILYIVEKYEFFYVYRLPPMYDAKLNNAVLSILTWAPLLCLGFGYWMFSNNQLLHNDLHYQTEESPQPRSGHIWYSVFLKDGYVTPASLPLILFFWVFFVGTVFRNPIYKYLAYWFPDYVKVGDFEVDEDLDNYFHTLDQNDRNWSIVEEKNARENLNMKILTDYTLHQL
jgi:hypothetical protein